MPAMLDRYLLKSCLGLFAGLTGLALAILLLERMIRVTEIIANYSNTTMAAVRMIVNLVPHYLEMALPGALLIAIIVSVDRLSRSGEMVAFLSTGVSLHRIVVPYLGLAVVLMITSLFISGFLQPLTRYNYREIMHDLAQQSVVAAFQERKFVQFGNRVIWTRSMEVKGHKLGGTFILETNPDGSRRFMTGRAGALREGDDGGWVISLRGGMLGTIPADLSTGRGDRLTVDNLEWRLPYSIGAFRARGADERELTLFELISARYDQYGGNIDPVIAAADLHDRLSRAALLTVLPLIGVILGLNLGRATRFGGVAIGILLLLLVQKLLEYGLAMAERGAVPAWAGLWPVVITVGAGAAIIFQYKANGRFWLRGAKVRAVPPGTEAVGPPSPDTGGTASR